MAVLASQYLKADGTTTGSESVVTVALAADATSYAIYPNTWSAFVTAPTDAAYLRLRIGVRRNTMAATDTGTIDLTDIRKDRFGTILAVGDTYNASTYSPGTIDQGIGSMLIRPGASTVTYAQLDSGTGYISMYANSTFEFKPGGSGVLAASITASALTVAATVAAIFNGGYRGTVIRPSISGTVNNWNPTGLLPGVTVLADLGGANRTITGIAAQADGALLFIMSQSSTNTITLSHLDAGSNAANQFRCPAGVNYVIGNKAGVTLVYDATDQKWRVVNNA